MKFSIDDKEKDLLLGKLKTANLKFQQIYPGDKPERQAVHTVYGGANLFKSDTTVKMGEVALRNLLTNAPNFVVLAKVLQLEGHEHLPHTENDIADLTARLDAMTETQRKKEYAWLSYSVYNKIIKKLKAEAVEDFRIDFEDGFGNRPDEEEDATAVNASTELALGNAEQNHFAIHRHSYKTIHRRFKTSWRTYTRYFFNDITGKNKWKVA
jgi:hypothetical protein